LLAITCRFSLPPLFSSDAATLISLTPCRHAAIILFSLYAIISPLIFAAYCHAIALPVFAAFIYFSMLLSPCFRRFLHYADLLLPPALICDLLRYAGAITLPLPMPTLCCRYAAWRGACHALRRAILRLFAAMRHFSFSLLLPPLRLSAARDTPMLPPFSYTPL